MMLQTIKVEHVLRETVRSPYRDLVTRPTGAAVRTSIQQAIAEADCGAALLDFSDVGLVDFSCADEVVAKLLLDPRQSGRYFVLQGMRDDHVEAIEHVLHHHELTVAVHEPDGRRRVLGPLADELQGVFVEVNARGPLALEELARSLGWPSAQAAAALEALVRLRLIHFDGARFGPLPLP